MKKIIIFLCFSLSLISLQAQKEDPFGDGNDWKMPNYIDTIYHCHSYNELEIFTMRNKGIVVVDTCAVFYGKTTFDGISMGAKTKGLEFYTPSLSSSYVFSVNNSGIKLKLNLSGDSLKAIYQDVDEAAELLIEHTVEKYNGRMGRYKATIDSLQHIIAMFRSQGYKDMEDYLMGDTTTDDGILSLDNDTSFDVNQSILPDCDSIKQCYFDIIELQENQWLSIALKAEYQNLESWYDYLLTNCNAGKNVEYCNYYLANVFPRYESCLPCDRMQEITWYPTVTSRFWKWVPLPSSFEGWMTWRMEKAIKNGK